MMASLSWPSRRLPRWVEDGTPEIQLRQGEKRPDPLLVKRFSRQFCSRRWTDSRGGRVLGEAAHAAKCSPHPNGGDAGLLVAILRW